MTPELDAVLIRLQFVAYHQRRTDSALADDLDAVIRFAQSAPSQRQLDPALAARLERRAAEAAGANDAKLASDIRSAAELIRKLAVP